MVLKYRLLIVLVFISLSSSYCSVSSDAEARMKSRYLQEDDKELRNWTYNEYYFEEGAPAWTSYQNLQIAWAQCIKKGTEKSYNKLLKAQEDYIVKGGIFSGKVLAANKHCNISKILLHKYQIGLEKGIESLGISVEASNWLEQVQKGEEIGVQDLSNLDSFDCKIQKKWLYSRITISESTIENTQNARENKKSICGSR